MRTSYNLTDKQERTTRLIKEQIEWYIVCNYYREKKITLAEPVEVAVRGIDEVWVEEIESIIINDDGKIHYLLSTADYEVEEHTILDGEWIRILEEIENTLNIQ